MILISYHIDIDERTYYSDHAKRLTEQCDSLHLLHDIRQLALSDERGNKWMQACWMKYHYMLNRLQYYQSDLLLMDVDCDVLQFPDFEIKGDWGILYREDGLPHDYVHLVRYTENNIEIIKRILSEQPTGIDEHSAFHKWYQKLNYWTLPDGYFKIGLATEIPSRLAALEKFDMEARKK